MEEAESIKYCPPGPLLNLTPAVHCKVCKILVPSHIISNLLQAGGPLATSQRFTGIPVWIKMISSQHHLVKMKLRRTASSICIFFLSGQGWLGKKGTWSRDMDVARLFSHVTCSPNLTYIFIISVQSIHRAMYTCVPSFLPTYLHTCIHK